MRQLSVDSDQYSVFSDQCSVFLYGPSGSGKSTIGRILAKNLNLPFVDLDAKIEARSGMSIPEIFTVEGEAGFRERERQVLESILSPEEKIIALGGGTLTTSQNRELAEAYGKVLLLNAPAHTLLARLHADAAERPLLSGDAGEGLSNLLSRREKHYASFPLQVNTAGKTSQAVAWDIQVELGMFHLKSMATKQFPAYDVRVRAGGLDNLGGMLRASGLRGPVAVVTDENVGDLYLERVTASLAEAGFAAHAVTIPAGERSKTLETVSKLWEAFLSAKIERGSTILALGGGVVGDVTGFAAATFARGVAWVAAPTSLLSMVDASLGGKTGADLPQGKNLIGAFYPPRLVLADPRGLETLPDVELANGMAEVVKHGVIADPSLFEACQSFRGSKNLAGLEEIVRRGMAVKVGIIEEDPYEKGIRAALNYGHTVGHGVELVSGFRVRHGEAVSIGMVAEARMAESIGLAQAGLAGGIAALLSSLGLPTEIPPGLDRDAIVAAMQRDKKKAAGIVRFALPAAIGDVRVGVEVGGWILEVGY